MKVVVTAEVSDEAALAIGLVKNGTVTRATRNQTREFLMFELEQILDTQEQIVKRITAEVFESAGLELRPLDVNEAASL